MKRHRNFSTFLPYARRGKASWAWTLRHWAAAAIFGRAVALSNSKHGSSMKSSESTTEKRRQRHEMHRSPRNRCKSTVPRERGLEAPVAERRHDEFPGERTMRVGILGSGLMGGKLG